MRLILTALIFVGGLFFLVTGLWFLVEPVSAGSNFGLIARDSSGLAAMRADFTAFFVMAAICMLAGAWLRRGSLLLIPAALFGIALAGRIVSALVDGTQDGFWQPMLVEAGTVIVLLIASRILPHRV
ncbi:hypothetical protein [Qipengyuania sp. JC766]|uniref:hypothetical protein n=1 Tax=Qipengyuania sp. JC766 TaxID=3232139 RepID=UPI0034573BCF